jgi:hypothetical protein
MSNEISETALITDEMIEDGANVLICSLREAGDESFDMIDALEALSIAKEIARQIIEAALKAKTNSIV